MAAKPRNSASMATKGPPKLVFSSDSSSSDDITPSPRLIPSKEQAERSGQETKRGRPLPVATEKANIGTSRAKPPKGAPKAPPPPAFDALDSLYVPGSAAQNRLKGSPPPGIPLAAEDPLLNIDTPRPEVQRVKSSAVVRAPSTRGTKTRLAKSASTTLRADMYQPLVRSASKTTAAKNREPVASQKSGGIISRKSRQGSAAAESLRGGSKPPASPRGPLEAESARQSRATQDNIFQNEGAGKVRQESSSEDAWSLTPRRATSTKPVGTSKDESPQSLAQALKDKGASTGGSPKVVSSLSFSKQRPNIPAGRSEQENKIGSSPRAGVSREEAFWDKRPPKNSPQNVLPVELEPVTSPRPKPVPDQAAIRDLEARLAKSRRRVSELEVHLQEVSRRHKEEIERLRLEHRSNLAEEVNKSKSERDEAIEKVRKEERGKMEEIKKQALARQNSVKMQCDLSVRELKEKVESLERQLRAKTEDFEKERANMQKSYEARRRSELEAQENEVKTQQRELKLKESELLEQQGRVQALTASMQTLTTSLAQMKELNDISRTAMHTLEEKTKTQAAFINTLIKREETLKAHAAKLMPIKEAKRLAFRALLKGRAVEMLTRACMPTDTTLWNKAWAFQQLVYLIGGPRGSKEKQQDAIESRLMQFRKEQMFLMAENERLMAKVAELQQEGVNQRQSKAALIEQALIGDGSNTLRNLVDFHKGSHDQGPNIRWLVLAVQHVICRRLLWAFLRLQKVTTEAESNITIDKLQKKFNELRLSAYKEMAARIGIYRLASYIRCLRLRLLFNAFFNIARNAGRLARDEALKQLENGAVLRDPFTKESVFTGSRYQAAYAGSGDERLDLNMPLAHQPPYYRLLPSVRNPVQGRNVFIPMVDRTPPVVQGYLPHPGYTNPHLTLGVAPVMSRGQRAGSIPGVPNALPSGPYDSTQSVEERGALFRMRGAQQELRRVMMESGVDKVGARIVGRKVSNTNFQ